tara:strand:+ start:226376 stop:228043 length:1668 start_codon:yes stop_codon:yes gene_type:complete
MTKKIGNILLLLLMIQNIFASDFSVKISPTSPGVNEVFEVRFTIPNNTKERPFISFDPQNVVVQERSQVKSSIATTYSNGKFTKVKKEDVFVYKMKAKKEGVVRLSNVQVDLNNRTLRHPNIMFRVTEKRRTNKRFFLEAEVSSDNVYIGEGFDLAYYLYYRSNIGEPNIKKFPKLNGFIKRFHNKRFKAERVYIEGIEYGKLKVYSARLYPQKTGVLNIDPIDVEVRFNNRPRNNNFGSFSFGFSQVISRDVTSTNMKINVNPLPVGAPDNFTGLVGIHSVRLKVAKEKFLVNEVMEAAVEIEGPGALESLDEIKLFESSSIEKFDTKSNLLELNNQTAKKTFDYTYLVRNNGKIEATLKRLSFFDPIDKEYKFVDFQIPEILFGGSAVVQNKIKNDINNSIQNIQEPSTNKVLTLSPQFNISAIRKALGFNLVRALNVLMLLAILTALLLFLLKREKSSGYLSLEDRRLLKNLKKKTNYSSLSRALLSIDKGKKTNGNLKEIVQLYKLDNENKILNIIDKLEKEFYKDKKEAEITIDRNIIKSIQKGLESAAN